MGAQISIPGAGQPGLGVRAAFLPRSGKVQSGTAPGSGEVQLPRGPAIALPCDRRLSSRVQAGMGDSSQDRVTQK